MKTYLLLFLSLVTLKIHAQQSTWRFGGGTHWSVGKNFIVDHGNINSSYFNLALSYNFQALAELKIASSVSIQSGIIFDNWRAKSIQEFETLTLRVKDTGSFLSIGIPVRGLFHFGNGNARPIVQAGASGSYLFSIIGRHYDDVGEGFTLSETNTTPADQLERKFLLNVEAGGGMEFNVRANSVLRVVPFFEYLVTSYFPPDFVTIRGHRWRTGLAISFLTGK